MKRKWIPYYYNTKPNLSKNLKNISIEIPLPNEPDKPVEPDEHDEPPVVNNSVLPKQNITSDSSRKLQLKEDDIILLTLIFLLINEKTEDKFLLIILLYIFLDLDFDFNFGIV